MPLARAGTQDGGAHSHAGPHPPMATVDAPGQGRAGGLPGLTAGQPRGAHAFFVVTTTSPSCCFSHLCVTQRIPGSDQDLPGCREAQPASEWPPQGPPSSRGGCRIHLSVSPEAPAASALRPPCTDGSPGAPVHQEAIHPAPPLSLCAPGGPPVQGWGWPPWSLWPAPPGTHPKAP